MDSKSFIPSQTALSKSMYISSPYCPNTKHNKKVNKPPTPHLTIVFPISLSHPSALSNPFLNP